MLEDLPESRKQSHRFKIARQPPEGGVLFQGFQVPFPKIQLHRLNPNLLNTTMKKSERLEPTQSESESNKSLRRTEWGARTHDAVTRDLLANDTRYFMHQESSTPCLSVVTQAEGAYIEDEKGRRYLDFHGNNVTISATVIRG